MLQAEFPTREGELSPDPGEESRALPPSSAVSVVRLLILCIGVVYRREARVSRVIGVVCLTVWSTPLRRDIYCTVIYVLFDKALLQIIDVIFTCVVVCIWVLYRLRFSQLCMIFNKYLDSFHLYGCSVTHLLV